MNYEAIAESLVPEKIEALLYRLGAEQVERKDTALITNTICHNVSGGSLKLYYYFNSHLFYCYTDEGAMSIFKFLRHYYDTRSIEYDWYRDIFCVVRECTKDESQRDYISNLISPREKLSDKYLVPPLPPKLVTYPNGIIEVYRKYYPIEWLNDGITKEAMDKFNIRFSPDENKIVIPHYNEMGQLIGIRGRALNQKDIENFGKYTPMQLEDKWHSHPLSLNLYGLNVTAKNIHETKIAYIFESEKAILQADSFITPNCGVAVCGANLNKNQVRLLMKTAGPRELVICFDNEEKKGELEYFEKLLRLCRKYNKLINMSFIYDRKGLTNPKDSPTDRGEEIFKKLLKERVKVK